MATILIVDDRPVNREFLVTLLGYSGHRLLEAGDGSEGLAVARAERPDLVIADVLMPTMDGYEFVRLLRADPAIADTRVVFYTAHYHEPEARRLASACGVSAVLTKPSEPEVVLRTVQAALGHTFPTIPAPTADDFDREHLQLLTDKLSQKSDELHRTNERLTALVELGLQLGSERDPARLLLSFCDAAREIVGARYAIVGVIDGVDPHYRHYLTSGMDVATVARLGRPGPISGVLGSVLVAGRCFRARNHGGLQAAGMPATFPPATALLAAPILSPARIYGWVCLLDKFGGDAFTEEDELLAKMLGAQVGRIYENGSLYADLLQHATKLAEEAAEKRRGELALRESEERFRGAFEHTGVAMVLTDINNTFIRVNASFAMLFGYTPPEMLGMTMADVTHPDDRAQSYGQREALLAGERPFFLMEKRYLHRDGHTFWGLTNVSLVRDPDDRPILYVGQVQDITDRKRAEAAVKRSAELLKAVADGTTDAVYVKDREGKYLLMNEAAAQFVGRRVEEVLGKDDTLLFDPIGARRIMAEAQFIMQSEQASTTEEVLTAAGVTRIYHTTQAPYRNELGKVIGVIGIARDISERKRAVQRLTTHHAIVSILAEAPSIQEAAPRLLRAICESLGWDVGGLWVVDREANVLRCVDLWHVENEAINEFRELSRRMTFAPGVGLPGRVWATCQPAWIVDITQDPNFPRVATTATAGLHGGFGFPIPFGNEVLGVAEFFSRESRPPDEDLIQLFSLIGSQIGQFIERMRTQEALTLFRALIDQVDDSIEIIDPESGRILDVNEAACVRHGYTRAEYLALKVSDLDSTVSGPGVWEQFVENLRRLGWVTHEGLHRRKDQSVFPVEIRAKYILNRRDYFVAVVRDITERKRSEQALRHAQQRLAHVIASSPAVLFTLAIEDNQIRGISWISDNLQELLGHAPADAYVEGWWVEHVHPDDRETLIAQSHKGLFGPGYAADEYRFRAGNGKYCWTRSEMRLVHDAKGEAVEAVGSWADVTERRLLEDQFRQSQKMEAVGRLAGGVAHDFNNLLTVINGYGELLLGSLPENDPTRDLIAEIVAAGERATGLTRQLLAFSRKAIIEPRVLDLRTVVTDVERMLGRIVGEDIELAFATDPDVGAVNVDPGQIEQVILNLVVNARDAMPKGGRLTIEVRHAELDQDYTHTHLEARTGPHVLLAVSDSGTGMDAATIARIFEPFFTTKGEQGTGLGLATVHGIVKQSGGHVAVYSEVGHGSTFKVYLPCTERLAPASPSRSKQSTLPRGKETILVVEDEDGVRALVLRVLRSCGYTLLEARNGLEGVRLAEEFTGRLDLLMTDVVMPQLGGRELSVRVSELHPEVKVLFLSGYTDDAVVRHGILEAEVAFLQKPFAPGSLAAKVREILDSA
jgi:PAS domain S-box-containing protein